jgi:hypothetical protein
MVHAKIPCTFSRKGKGKSNDKNTHKWGFLNEWRIEDENPK